ncbi:MAG: epoxyqueuosine reductase QueH [Rickettsiales bacterium]|jgi:predicted adenine nucleotide alpha hydrolase (AANH) superfamily ATPase|nr:epoxyqueuosine reductase QueH [Rickettsiales bacterium]
MRLVLMSCCAPCSAGAIRELAADNDFCVLFFNPNIYPFDEYQKRLDEQIKLCESLGIKYFVGDYNHDEWLKCARGLHDAPERGARCGQCFRHRFAYGIKWAAENGYDAIASVFGVSRHKSQAQVDDAARCAIRDAQCAVKYLPIKWDDAIRQEMLAKNDFYRQNYCGCEFSKRKQI